MGKEAAWALLHALRYNLTTTYNQRYIATGAELRDSQGKLLGHIVRTFDAGIVIPEQQIADAPNLTGTDLQILPSGAYLVVLAVRMG